MTPERRKALIVVVTTFVTGILVGILAGGLWNKYSGAGRRPMGWREGGRGRFIQKILTVVEADSMQARQMRPLMNQAMDRIDSVQQKTDREVHAVVDSLELKIRPILNDEQLKKLKEFHSRGRALRKDQQ